jgi:cobyrinic acid a,c-diamide synthase
VKAHIEAGLPVYAECGGAVYLGEKLLFKGQEFQMAGVLPVVFGFGSKPHGHGYIVVETVGDNPFFAKGETLRGHEFHYTYMQSSVPDELTFAFRVRRGIGFDGERDGLCRYNVLASYTHVHAVGTGTWAPSVVQAARRFKTNDRSVSTGSAWESVAPQPTIPSE